jgi:hypothetical protein
MSTHCLFPRKKDDFHLLHNARHLRCNTTNSEQTTVNYHTHICILIIINFISLNLVHVYIINNK